MSDLRTGSATEWLRGEGPSNDVVVSSRVRLARNFAGFPFPARCDAGQRLEVLEYAKRHILGAELVDTMLWIDLSELTALERDVLMERHLISKQHAKAGKPRALAVSTPDERLAIMVNEEDHLRIQAIRRGLDLEDAFRQVDEVDNALEAQADFAYSSRFGYLTACPTNVGTGVRMSVMLHLPGLKLAGDLEKVRRAARAMSLAVRGFYGEGSDAVGDFFQISNQTTLGKSERDLLHDFEHNVIPKVIDYERIARKALIEKRRTILEDQVHRAIGTLRHARLLKTDEAMQLLSLVRLGLMLDIVDGISLGQIGQMVQLIQPAHLQRQIGHELDQAERRRERATIVRQLLAGEQGVRTTEA